MIMFVFMTQLHIAAANGYLRVVEFLLDHNVATSVKDNDDWQPVHAAACWGHVSVLTVDKTCIDEISRARNHPS
jgi:ankyrin repeat protein